MHSNHSAQYREGAPDPLHAVDQYIERLCVPREEAFERALRDAEDPQ
jgi:hypothetical protein